MSLKEKIDLKRLPRHVAVIMDGNGRWAKQQGKLRTFGHTNGVTAVKETVEAAGEIGIEYLTLYAFSTENWKRPRIEVETLMQLLVQTIARETPGLMKHGIRLNTIGDLATLPSRVAKNLQKAVNETANNTKLTLTLALSYSSRWEITNAVKNIAVEVEKGRLNPADITEKTLEAHLATYGMPDPELMIRTSGEIRISNYLLWQSAYAEFYFTPVLWPDFRKEDFYAAIIDFQGRERRFGRVTEQLSPDHA
jgi:undecaprenyl diphosphate synthase